MLVIRPATKHDIETVSGLAEIGVKTPTMRAVVAEIDGRICGFGGMFLRNGRWYAVADIGREARRHGIVLTRAAARFLESAHVATIYAEADENEPRAVIWLIALGFEYDPLHGMYRWRKRPRSEEA